MTITSADVHKLYVEANSKAEHFLLAGLVAACAYLAQSNPYAPLGVNPQTLLVVDLLLLSLAAFFSYRRIENSVVVYKYNSMFLQSKESGDYVAYRRRRKIAIEYGYSNIRLRNLRNLLIVLGFFVYVGAKIWLAYKV